MDTDLQAALRVQIRKALVSDRDLADHVRELLAQASVAGQVQGDVTNTVAGSEIHGDNIQIGSAGRDVNVKRG